MDDVAGRARAKSFLGPFRWLSFVEGKNEGKKKLEEKKGIRKIRKVREEYKGENFAKILKRRPL